MNILLTGCTGVTGREVLTELLINSDLDYDKIICPVRGKNKSTAAERFKKIILKLAEENDSSPSRLSKKTQLIDTTKEESNFASVVEYCTKHSMSNLHVIQLASSTNLCPKATSEINLYHNCYRPSMDLFNKLKDRMGQFTFISTAFSCGHQEGMVPNSFDQLDIRDPRNYYEAYKLIAERKLKKQCNENDIVLQILRPAVVCGRLIREPHYYIPKFNVFYAYTSFFHAMKSRGINIDGIRIIGNPKSGVNIISSDYVAKSIVRAFSMHKNVALNLVHSRNLNNQKLIDGVFKCVGEKNYEFVDSEPKDKTRIEQFYYQSVGNQFTPYLDTYSHNFDVRNLRKLMHDVDEPDIEGEFNNLLQYASDRNFISVN